MSRLWAASLLVSVTFAVLMGKMPETGAASMEGAASAVEFILSTGGLICLWSGALEIMRRSGVLDALAALLSPLLKRLYPSASRDGETLEALTANVSANMLGLGNAATPMGIRAARRMAAQGKGGEASHELCLLVVMNTASIQLLPTTVAAVRAVNGASSPFDILPAVWLSSAGSVCAGMTAAALLRRLARR